MEKDVNGDPATHTDMTSISSAKDKICQYRAKIPAETASNYTLCVEHGVGNCPRHDHGARYLRVHQLILANRTITPIYDKTDLCPRMLTSSLQNTAELAASRFATSAVLRWQSNHPALGVQPPLSRSVCHVDEEGQMRIARKIRDPGRASEREQMQGIRRHNEPEYYNTQANSFLNYCAAARLRALFSGRVFQVYLARAGVPDVTCGGTGGLVSSLHVKISISCLRITYLRDSSS